MTDKQFETELRINAYINQIDGYPLGHPSRENFKPILVVFHKPDGTFNRQRTLDGPYTFTAEEKEALLKEG